jgi:hypothetical protein
LFIALSLHLRQASLRLIQSLLTSVRLGLVFLTLILQDANALL